MISAAKVRWSLISTGERFKLFLVMAFPIHLWVVLVGFQDLAYIISLNTPWDGVGFVSYLLLYSLIDSILIFLLISAISLLTPISWNYHYRFIWLSWLGISLTIFSIIEQYFLLEWFISFDFLQGLKWLSYPLYVGAALVIELIVSNWAIPIWLIRPYHRVQERLYSISEKLATLAGFYLFLDLAAIAIIVWRNIS